MPGASALRCGAAGRRRSEQSEASTRRSANAPPLEQAGACVAWPILLTPPKIGCHIQLNCLPANMAFVPCTGGVRNQRGAGGTTAEAAAGRAIVDATGDRGAPHPELCPCLPDECRCAGGACTYLALWAQRRALTCFLVGWVGEERGVGAGAGRGGWKGGLMKGRATGRRL